MFNPPGPSQHPASLTNLTNPDVFGRITLTNPTESSLTAKLKFTRVVCGDERKYQCIVLGLSNGVPSNIKSVTNLIVKANPDISSFGEVNVVPATNIAEGQTVQFTCSSNVGLPAGTFLWTKYRGVSDSVGSTVSSTTQTYPSTDCTYTGSSSINMAMTKDNDGIILRCTILQQVITDHTNIYHRQTKPINVFYKPYTPTMTKIPYSAIYDVDDDVTLTCGAAGNPLPTFAWWFNGTQVGSTAQLQLSNIYIDQSGLYVCEATNYFAGNSYSVSDEIDVTINAWNGACTTKSVGMILFCTKLLLFYGILRGLMEML
ncbi:cell adhesion molecule 2-like [Argopecten irradians]|uniref:cell adhesion molecule 2-like n=1 Tax=Argopecten irradians TaxID=31199 RepID=UPI003720C54C